MKNVNWKKIKARVENRDKGLCSLCGTPVGIHGTIETRSVFPYRMYLEKYYTPDSRDFITTCRKCSKNLTEIRAREKGYQANGRNVSMCIELTPEGPIERRKVF